MLKDYINSFTYNGHSSLEYGLAINSKNNVFGAPKPVIEKSISREEEILSTTAKQTSLTTASIAISPRNTAAL